MKPLIEAFLRAEISWKTIKGIKMVYDNEEVTLNTKSTERITDNINTK